MSRKDFAPLHPGEVLLEEFLKPLGYSQHQLALAMRVSPQKINDIVHGKRAVTADTALRLSRALGTTAEFWMGLQADFDLDTALDTLGESVLKDVKPLVV